MAKQVANFRWDDKEFQEITEKQIQARLNKAAAYLRGQVVKSISKPGRTKGPSKPKQPPHADTGKLRQSIFHQVNKAKREAIVGSTSLVGLYMEKGTKQKKAIRPVKAKALTIPLHAKAQPGGGAGKLAKVGRDIMAPDAKMVFVKSKGRKMWVVFRKIARPKGVKPRPFLKPALRKNWPTIKKILEDGKGVKKAKEKKPKVKKRSKKEAERIDELFKP